MSQFKVSLLPKGRSIGCYVRITMSFGETGGNLLAGTSAKQAERFERDWQAVTVVWDEPAGDEALSCVLSHRDSDLAADEHLAAWQTKYKGKYKVWVVRLSV